MLELFVVLLSLATASNCVSSAVIVSHTGNAGCSADRCTSLNEAIALGHRIITLEASSQPHLVSADLDVAGVSLNCSDSSASLAAESLSQEQFTAGTARREEANSLLPGDLWPFSNDGRLCLVKPASTLDGLTSIRLVATAQPGSSVTFVAENIVFFGFIGQSEVQELPASVQIADSGAVLSVQGSAEVSLLSCIFTRNRAASWRHQLNAMKPDESQQTSFQRLRDMTFGAVNIVERWNQATGSAVSVYNADASEQKELWPELYYQKSDPFAPLQNSPTNCGNLNYLGQVVEILASTQLFPNALSTRFSARYCDIITDSGGVCPVLSAFQTTPLNTSNLWEPVSAECAKFVSMPKLREGSLKSRVVVHNTVFWGNGGQAAALLLNGADALISKSAFVFNNGALHQARGPYSGGAIRAAGNSNVTIQNTRVAHNSATHGSGITCWDSVLDVDNLVCEQNAAEVSSACMSVGNFLARTSDEASLPAPQIRRTCNATIRNSAFLGNVAQRGAVGALGVFGSSHALVKNTSFSANFASVTGGVFVSTHSKFDCHQCSFFNNSMGEPFDAGGSALAVLDGSAVRITDSVFQGNSASNSGGAVGIYGSSLVLGTRRGVAFPCTGSFDRVIFRKNRAMAGQGGGIQVSRGNISISDCLFEGNSANRNGGAINIGVSPDLSLWDYDVETQGKYYESPNFVANTERSVRGKFPYAPFGDVRAHAFISRTVFDGNSAAIGGGGALSVTRRLFSAAVSSSTFVNNIAPFADAGAIKVAQFASILLVNSTLVGNTAQRGRGGGLHATQDAVAVVTRSSFSKNAASGISGGSAIAGSVGARMQVSDTNISENQQSQFGGSIWVEGSQASFANLTVSDSLATPGLGGIGGALLASAGSMVSLVDAHFSDNSAGQGGCLAAVGSSFLNISRVVFIKCSAAESGGAIFVESSNFTGQDMLSQGTTADGGNGGFMFTVSSTQQYLSQISTLTVSDSGAFSGGAFACSGGLLELNAVESMNAFAETEGGFLAVRSGCKVVLQHSFISSVGANTGQGGGLFARGEASRIILNGTVRINGSASPQGGCGFFGDGAAMELLSASVRLSHCFATFANGGALNFLAASLSLLESTLRIDDPISAASGAALYSVGSTIGLHNQSHLVASFGVASLRGGLVFLSGGASGICSAVRSGSEDLYIDKSSIFELESGISDAAGTLSRGGGMYAGNKACVLVEGHLSVSSCTAGFGGGIALDTNAALQSSSSASIFLRENSARASGGAMWCSDCVGYAQNMLVVNNTAAVSLGSEGGAGIFITGASHLSVSESFIGGNRCPFCSGGGILVTTGGQLALDRSTLFNNSAHSEGGGISAQGQGAIALTTCNVTDNTAELGAQVSLASSAIGEMHGAIRLKLAQSAHGSKCAQSPGLHVSDSSLVLHSGALLDITGTTCVGGGSAAAFCSDLSSIPTSVNTLRGSAFLVEGQTAAVHLQSGSMASVQGHHVAGGIGVGMSVAFGATLAVESGAVLRIVDGSGLAGVGLASVGYANVSIAADFSSNPQHTSLFVLGNKASACGAGVVFADGAFAVMHRVRVSNNSAREAGAAIFMKDSGKVEIRDSYVSDNAGTCTSGGIVCIATSGVSLPELFLPSWSAQAFQNTAVLPFQRDVSCPVSEAGRACRMVDLSAASGVVPCNAPRVFYVVPGASTDNECCGSIDKPCHTIQAAIVRAKTNDTIVLSASDFVIAATESIEINGASISVQVADGAAATLRCSGARRSPVLTITNSRVLIDGLGFEDCFYAEGAFGNSTHAAAVAVSSSDLVLQRARFVHREAGHFAQPVNAIRAIYAVQSPVVILGTLFSGLRVSFPAQADSELLGSAVLMVSPGSMRIERSQFQDCGFLETTGSGALAVVDLAEFVVDSEVHVVEVSCTSCSAARGGCFFIQGSGTGEGGDLNLNIDGFHATSNRMRNDGRASLPLSGGADLFAQYTRARISNMLSIDAISIGAVSQGGSILITNSEFSAENSRFVGCSASAGGCMQASAGAFVSLEAVDFSGGRAQLLDGGAIQCSSCDGLILQACTFESCTAARNGGAVRARSILAPGSFSIVDSTVTQATARSGGGISVLQSTMHVSNTTFEQCEAQWRGGGLHVVRPILGNIRESTIIGCKAPLGGGGIAIQHDTDSDDVVGISISNSVLSDNTACQGLELSPEGFNQQCSGGGGALLVNRIRDNPFPVLDSSGHFSLVRTLRNVSLRVEVCDGTVLSGNTALAGGAVLAEHHGVRLSIHSTCEQPVESMSDAREVIFDGNSAMQRGGALAVGGFAEAVVSAARLASNVALQGGAISSSGALLHVSRSVFHRNRLWGSNVQAALSCDLSGMFLAAGAALHIQMTPEETTKRLQTLEWQHTMVNSFMSSLEVGAVIQSCQFSGHTDAALVSSIGSSLCAGEQGFSSCSKMQIHMEDLATCSRLNFLLDWVSTAAELRNMFQTSPTSRGDQQLPRFTTLVSGNAFVNQPGAMQTHVIWDGWAPAGYRTNKICETGQQPVCTNAATPSDLRSGEVFDCAIPAALSDPEAGTFLVASQGIGSAPLTALVAVEHTSTESVQPLQVLDAVHLLALDAYGLPAVVPSAQCAESKLQIGIQRSSARSIGQATQHVLQGSPAKSNEVLSAVEAWGNAAAITAGSRVIPQMSLAAVNISRMSGTVWSARLTGEIANALSGNSFSVSVFPSENPSNTQLLGFPPAAHSIVVEFCNPGFAPLGAAGLCADCAPGWVSANGTACSQCPAGTIAEQAVRCVPCPSPFYSIAGSLECLACADDHYVAGNGAAQCTKCPLDSFGLGSECQGGEIRLSPGFFFVEPGPKRSNLGREQVVSVLSQPLSAATAVHSCLNPDACITSPDRKEMQCAEGYGGVLCGDCVDGFLSAGGGVCLPCLADGVNYSVLVLVSLAVVGAVVYVSLSQTFEEKDDFNIALRLLLNHLQMMGLLSLLRAQGTTLFRGIFNFSGVVSGGGIASPITSARCIWNSNFYTDFALNLSTPPLLMFVCVLTGTIAAGYSVLSRVADERRFLARFLAAKTADKRRDLLSVARMKAVAKRRASSVVAGRNPLKAASKQAEQLVPATSKSKSPSKASTAPVATSQTDAPPTSFLLKARQQCSRCVLVCCGQGCAVGRVRAATLAMGDYVISGDYFSTLAFIASTTFSLVTTSVLNAFRCTDFDAYGSRWLLADMSIPCFDSTHILVLVFALVYGFIFCIGFPVAVIMILQRNKSALAFDPKFRERYAFLIAGYTNEQAQAEGYGMLRRLAIALVSVISSPIHEINAAAVIILAAISLHVSTQPFKRKVFNLVESISLWTVELTLMISLAFLEVTRTTSASGVVDDAGTDFNTINIVITVMLCVVNFAALAVMLIVLLRFGSHFVTERLEQLGKDYPWLAQCLPSTSEKPGGLEGDAGSKLAKAGTSVRSVLQRVASGIRSTRASLRPKSVERDSVPCSGAATGSSQQPTQGSLAGADVLLLTTSRSGAGNIIEAHNPLLRDAKPPPKRPADHSDSKTVAPQAQELPAQQPGVELPALANNKSIFSPAAMSGAASLSPERATFKSSTSRRKRVESSRKTGDPQEAAVENPLLASTESHNAVKSRTKRLSLVPGMDVLVQQQQQQQKKTNLHSARRRRASLLRKASVSS